MAYQVDKPYESVPNLYARSREAAMDAVRGTQAYANIQEMLESSPDALREIEENLYPWAVDIAEEIGGGYTPFDLLMPLSLLLQAPWIQTGIPMKEWRRK